MQKYNLDGLVIQATNNAFDILKELYKNGTSANTKLIIPPYYHSKKNTNGDQKICFRLSEQELRFLFVEQISKLLPDGYSYSIESPTLQLYRFTKKGEKLKPLLRGEGESGNFDFTIQQSGHVEAIVEFKARTLDSFSYAKDLCKLWNPIEGQDALRYFIIVFESLTKSKYESLIDAIKNNKYFRKQDGDADVFVVCKSLSNGQEFEISKMM